MKKEKPVFGLLHSNAEIETAVDLLRRSGFRPLDVSVLIPQKEETKRSTVGSGLGWLFGIGVLMIPGLGPFLAAGPIAAAIAGIGVRTTVGGVTGGLIGFGIPEYIARRYESFLKDDGILISVHTDNSKWRKKAQEVLEAAGANDILTTEDAKAPSISLHA